MERKAAKDSGPDCPFKYELGSDEALAWVKSQESYERTRLRDWDNDHPLIVYPPERIARRLEADHGFRRLAINEIETGYGEGKS